MVVFEGISPFRRITLWVAIETMRFSIAGIRFSWEKFLWHARGPNEQFDTHGILSFGSKVGQIRSQGTCKMILFAGFQRYFFIFRMFSRPKKTIYPQIFLRIFL